MIGALIGAGVALGSNVYNSYKAGQAVKRQNELLDSEQSRVAGREAANKAWYEGEYYKDYLNGSTAQSAIRRVEDSINKRREERAASAAVTGATPEAVLAGEANDQAMLSDTMVGLAGQGEAAKANTTNLYRNMQASTDAQRASIANARMGQLQATEAGYSQGAANAATALGSVEWDKVGKGVSNWFK